MEKLPIVLDIEKVHSADMERKDTSRFKSEKLHTGWFIHLSCGTEGMLRIESMTDECLTVRFNGESRTLVLGDSWTIESLKIFNPIDSSDMGTFTIHFHRLTFWEYISWLMDEIMRIHEKSLHPLILSTVDNEQEVLRQIGNEIADGNVGLYPLKAWLTACNNWYTGKILRRGQFESILLEGIEKGALAPDDAEGWEWLKVAASSNDPAEFMTDMDRYYGLLASAAEAGNTDALDIMNEIWPPEQIIEED